MAVKKNWIVPISVLTLATFASISVLLEPSTIAATNNSPKDASIAQNAM